MAVVNVYLDGDDGLYHKNWEALIAIQEVLAGLGFPFIVCGDWNTIALELEESEWPGPVGDASVAAREWTCANHTLWECTPLAAT